MMASTTRNYAMQGFTIAFIHIDEVAVQEDFFSAKFKIAHFEGRYRVSAFCETNEL